MRSISYIITLFLLGAFVITGCTSEPVDQIEIMPAPDVYGNGMLNPLPEQNPFDRLPYDGILFATDRTPAKPGDREKYYRNDRGQLIRVGLAQIEFGKKEFSWDLARDISMLKSRSDTFPVRISDVEEWGFLESTIPFWIDRNMLREEDKTPDATDRFVDAINSQLRTSGKKHVYIYVHGYKVEYENPVLVSAELWHFLGYNGVFIAYVWPSTPARLAYIKDSDTLAGFSRNLRLLLEFLSNKTDTEEIHVIGYSNGTRLVTRVLEQLALIHTSATPEELWQKLRIRNVILVGSDLDPGVFGTYMADGLLNVSRHMTIYMSKYDKVLGVSQFLTRRQRLGQLWGGKGGELHPQGRQAIEKLRDQISFINVSSAEGADTGTGHGYFRSSPWASSGILMTIYYGLTPKERGLIIQKDFPVFTFPTDYILRLWEAIEDVEPEFAENYRAFKAAQTTNQ